VKEFFNWLAKPSLFFILFSVAVFAMLKWRKVVTAPKVALGILASAVVFFLWALRDPGFHANISKPDNIPIVFMLFLVGYFSWLGLYRAVRNDRRLARGELPEEAAENPKKVLVWPDLVYSEFVCMLIGTAILIVWAVLLKAPLEEPSNPNKTPNPSKAPWYFLGLQEMLVYFDPWLAGVILPGLIIAGLMAVPYVDTNPKGNGYFTFNERPFAITSFFFGFIVLWVSMIILMTFLRGPNQAFFGPFQPWNPHMVEPTVNVQFSQLFWEKWLGTSKPTAWFARELPGILIVVGYLAVTPMILAKTICRKMVAQMGVPRYLTMMLMFLIMVALPVKMMLRWSINLQYIVNIQEIFLNI
jgi:hypothetical protein